ncbi:hypothetical protein CA13_27410 [Planctomycetes bacterium CA13]|uniref:Uncharacterized protein n=1 Tax=Novipirellula herctigrandis TaxID=2527986 RepID=A0A5C5Z284_9BACT|nr:hypothetical protein CA13_27410 [Planctomycetes bacterium CA13]
MHLRYLAERETTLSLAWYRDEPGAVQLESPLKLSVEARALVVPQN